MTCNGNIAAIAVEIKIFGRKAYYDFFHVYQTRTKIITLARIILPVFTECLGYLIENAVCRMAMAYEKLSSVLLSLFTDNRWVRKKSEIQSLMGNVGDYDLVLATAQNSERRNGVRAAILRRLEGLQLPKSW